MSCTFLCNFPLYILPHHSYLFLPHCFTFPLFTLSISSLLSTFFSTFLLYYFIILILLPHCPTFPLSVVSSYLLSILSHIICTYSDLLQPFLFFLRNFSLPRHYNLPLPTPITLFLFKLYHYFFSYFSLILLPPSHTIHRFPLSPPLPFCSLSLSTHNNSLIVILSHPHYQNFSTTNQFAFQ